MRDEFLSLLKNAGARQLIGRLLSLFVTREKIYRCIVLSLSLVLALNFFSRVRFLVSF